jgi:hypothetical protein
VGEAAARVDGGEEGGGGAREEGVEEDHHEEEGADGSWDFVSGWYLIRVM